MLKVMASLFLAGALSACAAGQGNNQSRLELNENQVTAAKTIPVSRLKIQVIETPSSVKMARKNGAVTVDPESKKLASRKCRRQCQLQNNAKVLSQPQMPQVMNYLAETVYFADGSSKIAQNDRHKLRLLAEKLKAKNASVSIYGYASSRTKDTDLATHKLINFNISAQRADEVALLLQKFGVAAENINIEALSDSKPAYLEIMPKNESLNRRVEIFATY